jgi:hypothetical protein
MSVRSQRAVSLWWLVVAPGLWALHLLASYATVAIWCQKAVSRDGSLGAARIAVFVYTAVALLGVLSTGVRGYRRHRFGDADPPHDADTPMSRYRFLGFTTLLLSVLSAIAIVYAALPAVFIRSCR